jgi:hypothetical protein
MWKPLTPHCCLCTQATLREATSCYFPASTAFATRHKSTPPLHAAIQSRCSQHAHQDSRHI